ncbi:hypothetical protein PCANC_00347 [Puccinia coronata f. sp. avenae]|uniref:Uncharacterized protein n=1 Tax=Puccinia coronata f. sp. avenae TaxID=200324 RepID=A0A2N5W918_9BASI|nr:hypothetical protein PCANC_27894 [Puccinia coronata f. sp. avenae]PLW58732.1 hypothetical protein PCANC_00347 [Puccinia coronata f. sp. avenae]
MLEATSVGGEANFKAKLTKPQQFRGKINQSAILHLTQRQGDRRLLLGLPANKVGILKGEKAGYRTPIEKAVTPVGVSEATQHGNGVALIDQSIVACSKEITEDVGEAFPVVYAGILKKLRKMADGKGDICSASSSSKTSSSSSPSSKPSSPSSEPSSKTQLLQLQTQLTQLQTQLTQLQTQLTQLLIPKTGRKGGYFGNPTLDPLRRP